MASSMGKGQADVMQRRSLVGASCALQAGFTNPAHQGADPGFRIHRDPAHIAHAPVQSYRLCGSREGNDVRFSLRPVFVGWVAIATQIPLQLFFTVWAGLFFGGMTSFMFPNSPARFVFFGALAFFGIPTVIYVSKKLGYARTEYKFFDDRLEFEEGFFSLNKKTIRLRDVREVTLRKGLFQRWYGLGSIYLATLATGSWNSMNAFTTIGFGNVSASGIVVRDIATPDEAYEQISKLIELSREER
jgi:uncharacterized membrane protein YdbT with pleckstrin-like domain